MSLEARWVPPAPRNARIRVKRDPAEVINDKQLVKDAPRIDADQHLSQAEEQRLDKDTVTGQERVTEELRKERIDVQDEDTKSGRRERRRRR